MTLEIIQKKKPGEIQYADVVQYLKGLILEAYTYEGRAFPGGPEEQEQEINFQVKSLIEDLQQPGFKSLILEEIRRAFKNGLRGVYGEYFGLNNKTYNLWITGFKNAKQQEMRSQGMDKAGLPQKTEPTEQEKEQIFQDELASCIARFKKDGSISDIGGSIYDGLVFRGMLKLSFEEKVAYVEQAKQNELARLNKEKADAMLRLNKIEVRQADFRIAAVKEGSNWTILEAKRLALKDYIIKHHTA